MRLRTIKPGFFKNEDLAALPPLARLLFAGLWCIADREGRLEDRPRRIKALILPYDDDADANDLIERLAAAGFVERYEASGVKCIRIVNFLLHQQPHYKEVASVLPSPSGEFDGLRVASGVTAEMRERVMTRDGRRCRSCAATDDLAIDHIIPRSRGGTGEEDNLQVLCRKCNSSKGNRASPKIGSTMKQPRSKHGPTKAPNDPLSSVLPSSGLLSSVNGLPSLPPPSGAASPTRQFTDGWGELFRRHRDGAAYAFEGAKDGANVKAILKLAGGDVGEALRRAEVHLTDPFWAERGANLGTLKGQWNRCVHGHANGNGSLAAVAEFVRRENGAV